MRLAFVIHLTGVMVRLFAGAYLAPLAVALYYGERYDAAGFLVASLGSFVAGHLMRRVAEDPTFRTRIGERAKETMRTRFSPRAAGLRYRARLAFLGLMHEMPR